MKIKVRMLLFSMCLSLVLWNCTDTFWFTEGNREVEHENFTLQEAREFFNESTMRLAIVSRSMQDDGKTRLSAGEFTPDWNNSVASAKNDLMCYDVPIDCEHTYKAVMLIKESTITTLDAVDVYQKLVIVKSRTTGKIGQYLLTLVPDIEYERQHQGKVADLFINAGDKGGFSGVVIYSIPGLDLIVRVNRYTTGIKTKGIYLSGDKKEMKEKIFRLKSILRPFQLYKSSVVQSRNVSENLILQIIKDYNNLTKVDDYWIYIDENGEEYRLLDEDGDGIPDTFWVLPNTGDEDNTEPAPDPDPEEDPFHRCPRCGRVSCDGNCITSGGGSSGGGNNPNQVNATELTNAAKSAVDYVNEKFGKTKAYCNRGVARAFEILFGDSKFHNMNANTMVQYWEDHPESWHSIPMSQAQYWANQGYFVVAGWINPSGESGHVVVVVPGEGLQHSGWGGKIPHVMDTGAGKRTVGKTINYSFGKGKISSIKYYVYK